MDRCLNSIISGTRISVENTIAGVKRCRIVKDVFRNTKDGFSDLAMEVACALHSGGKRLVQSCVLVKLSFLYRQCYLNINLSSDFNFYPNRHLLFHSPKDIYLHNTFISPLGITSINR